ncbi:SOS response-associated peptidase [Mycobacterium frederiksbergense]|uniref:Abasic site processing protein n=1 Tax=Mycolicibacterium frederiksbergense TaxID=117567 RepID=A0A6H0S316_9MYCO|nr:SOS response-associated peptidase [Mycolicibacterium frederiksbergense]MCV7047418.1 SOS response-associated peptidase [Mycolicibacterium frederiksbergense]QIV80725.1 SOS response-associated peptidase [Mycolicibacterium frederiksbergense]
MCGRFAVTTDPALLAEKIKALDETVEAAKDGGPNFNVAPTTTISTVVKRHDHAPSLRSPGSEPDDESTRRLRSMRWGLIPPWAKTGEDGGPDTKKGPLLINARSETLTTSPAFRGSAKSKRCLVPMDGWYEWKPNPAADGKKASKTPFYMFAGDGEPLFMAGLWSTWRPKEADREAPPLLSCTIITTDSAAQLADIHDRMPLTISASDWDRWLDPDAPIDEGLLRGHGDLDRIEIREVSRLVNSVRNNGPELIEAVAPEAGLF